MAWSNHRLLCCETASQQDAFLPLQAAASAIAQASTPEVAQAQATAIAKAYSSGKTSFPC